MFDSPIILVMHDDDMLPSTKKKSTMKDLKQPLNIAFSVKNLGAAEHILGGDCSIYKWEL